jgi:hypothetical protein
MNNNLAIDLYKFNFITMNSQTRINNHQENILRLKENNVLLELKGDQNNCKTRLLPILAKKKENLIKLKEI